jgi:hypothetical protein
MYQRRIMPMDQIMPSLPGLQGHPQMMGPGPMMMPPVQMPQQDQGMGMLGMLPMLGMLNAKPQGGISLMDLLRGAGQPQSVLNLQPGFLASLFGG